MTDAAKKVEKNLEDLEHSPGPYVDYLLKGVPFGQTEPLIKTAVFLCPKQFGWHRRPGKEDA